MKIGTQRKVNHCNSYYFVKSQLLEMTMILITRNYSVLLYQVSLAVRPDGKVPLSSF